MQVETKNIDELAKNGLRFTDFHMGVRSLPVVLQLICVYQASVCTPSRAALLTGRLGLRTGTVQNFGETAQFGLPFNETIIPEYLKASGYGLCLFCCSLLIFVSFLLTRMCILQQPQ